MNNQKFEFLLESYKSSIEYYNNYTNGVWTRFSIFFTVDVAIFGILFGFFGNTSMQREKIFPLIFLGILVSFILYIQSAQERYILSQQRNRINELKKMLEKITDLDHVPTLFSPLDAIDMGKKKFIFNSLVSWRSTHFSITRIPAVTSLLLLIVWIIITVLLVL
jgi:hypothetical protein